MPTIFGELILLALAVAVASFTLSKATICKPLRRLADTYKYLGLLIHCPYCLSHWFALLGVLSYLSVSGTLISIVVYTLAVTALANLIVLGLAYSILIVNELGDD